jgi:hypothetical protein
LSAATNEPVHPIHIYVMLGQALASLDGTSDQLAAVRRSIAEVGIEPNCHAGQADLTPRERAEWALGQFASAHGEGALGSGAVSEAVRMALRGAR